MQMKCIQDVAARLAVVPHQTDQFVQLRLDLIHADELVQFLQGGAQQGLVDRDRRPVAVGDGP